MKPQTELVATEGNISGEAVAMRLDPEATAHLMSVLTNLYSNPILAVIREYATNGLDAHKVAGQGDPIEVELPTELAPYLKVRDFGVGLSAADIRDVYSSYGTSTKRDSNEAVGMLGLGCKSALTYADSFTVKSTHKGRTVEVLVARDEDGGGSMTIASDEASAPEAREGTEVIVPTKRADCARFEREALAFFKYWAEGTVLVNGKAPERIDGLWLTERLLYTPEGDGDVCVMGNVPYPMPEADEDGGGYRGYRRNERNLVAYVDIGEVAFVPSREALHLTKATKAKLASLRAEAKAARDASVMAQVANATSASEAVALLREGQAIGFEGKAIYKGREVELSLSRAPLGADGKRKPMSATDATVAPASATYLTAFDRYQKVKGERSFNLNIERAREATIFEGFEARELSPTKRDKLNLWAEAKGITLGHGNPLIAVDKLNATERFWLEGCTIHPWAEVEAIVLPKVTRADGTVSGRPRGSYKTLTAGDIERHSPHADATEADELSASLANGATVYYFQGNALEALGDRYSYRGPEGCPALKRKAITLGPADFLVCLEANRVEKFKRDFPEALEIGQAARAKAEAWRKTITERELAAYAVQNENHADDWAKLDPERVRKVDPELAEAIVLARHDLSAVKDGASKFGAWVSLNATSSRLGDALKRYPLLGPLFDGYARVDGMLEHVYTYIEAVAKGDGTEARKGGKGGHNV